MKVDYTGKPSIDIDPDEMSQNIAKGEDPDEMPQNAAFHQVLHCLLRYRGYSIFWN